MKVCILYIEILIDFINFIPDINDECYPAISLKLSTGDQNERDSSTRILMIKDEPMSECESPPSSCPPSPTMTMPSHRNRSEKRVNSFVQIF